MCSARYINISCVKLMLILKVKFKSLTRFKPGLYTNHFYDYCLYSYMNCKYRKAATAQQSCNRNEIIYCYAIYT